MMGTIRDLEELFICQLWLLKSRDTQMRLILLLGSVTVQSTFDLRSGRSICETLILSMCLPAERDTSRKSY